MPCGENSDQSLSMLFCLIQGIMELNTRSQDKRIEGKKDQHTGKKVWHTVVKGKPGKKYFLKCVSVPKN